MSKWIPVAMVLAVIPFLSYRAQWLDGFNYVAFFCGAAALVVGLSTRVRAFGRGRLLAELSALLGSAHMMYAYYNP